MLIIRVFILLSIKILTASTDSLAARGSPAALLLLAMGKGTKLKFPGFQVRILLKSEPREIGRGGAKRSDMD